MMRWANFLDASGGKRLHGPRQRVAAIDAGVQAYEAQAPSWSKQRRWDALEALRLLCADYLADTTGKAQKRLDGVQALTDAIQTDLDDLAADDELTAEQFLSHCQNGRTDELAALLGRDPRVDWRDGARNTGLHVAARYGKPEIVTILLDAGAEIDAAGQDGNTPLHVAAGMGQLAILTLLLGRGADLEARNSEGFTPLAHAARMSRGASVGALLAAGAEKDTPALFGFTALDFSRSFASMASETLLLGANAHGRSLSTIVIPPIPRADTVTVTRRMRSGSPDRLDTIEVLADQLHTVDVLMLATTEDPANGAPGSAHARDVAGAYWALYQVPELRPILGAVALAAIGARTAGGGACRIFATNDESVGRIGGMGAGVLQNINNVVNCSRKPTQLSMEGTLVHELCHGAAHFVFANDVMPFPRTGAPGSEVAPDYLAALDGDLNANWRGMYGKYSRYLHGDDPAIDSENGRAYTTLLGRLQGYSGSGRIVAAAPEGSSVAAYPLGFVFEAIVGIPQCWHVFGRERCQTWAPRMLGYYEGTFLPAVEDWIRAHPQAAKLDPLPLRDEPVGERKLSEARAFDRYRALLAT